MIDSGIVWRMAVGNLRKQWKGTLLTVFAGAIGAILIAISFVNYTSVMKSGEEWVETRLGPINWRLIPESPGTDGFGGSELNAIRNYINQHEGSFRMLPYITADAALVAKEAGDGREGRVLKSVMLIGFPLEDAARLEPERAELWQGGLGDDELILSERIAETLGVGRGDAVELAAGEQRLLMRVRDVVQERGLTGYRDAGGFTGNAVASERTVRLLSGASGYPAILMGNADPNWPIGGMFHISGIDYQVQTLKIDYLNKVNRMNTSIIIGMISSVAIVSSMLFMRQSFVMIADSRREMYGLFRAIGLPRRSVFGMFAIESLLISLFSALAGAGLGTLAGYGLVRLFYQAFSGPLSRMAGEAIPIEPHITLGGAAAVFAAVFALLTVVSIMAAFKASDVGIVEAMRGEAPAERSGRKPLRLRAKVMIGIGLFMTAAHLAMAFVKPPGMDEGVNLLWVVIFWIGACCTVLFLAIVLIGLLERPLVKLLRMAGMPPLSVMLAVKYPSVHLGRTYTIGLLFALVMMMISFTVTLISIITSFNDVNRVDQTIAGYGGYAAYQTEKERANILRIAAEDPDIAGHLAGVTHIEPFMISFAADELAQSIVPVSDDMLNGPELPLLARAEAFGSDREAWEAVLSDPSYIILPHSYLGRTDLLPGGEEVQAGGTYTFPIYENKLRGMNERWTPITERTFTVAGIFHDVAGRSHIRELYDTTFVHPSAMKELKPYGFKWDNHRHHGFVLFRFDHTDIALAQRLEERFALSGVMSFTVPYLNNSAEQMMNKQLGYAFVAFTVFSALIGLMGLAIIQYRAVRERSKQVAMMRCVGVAGRQIYWMFIIEGFVIGALGLLTGWAIGATGSRLFIASAMRDQLPFEQAEASYPFGFILLLLAGLLLLALVLNIAPARAALRFKAADALRMNNE